MPGGRNTRMQQWMNYRMRVTLQEKRVLVGTFMAFDRHMNIVLCDCEEFRRIRLKGSSDEKEVKRPLGFVMIRGENIISMSAEAPPTANVKKLATLGETAASTYPGNPSNQHPSAIISGGGPGKGQPAGRGAAAAMAAAAGVMPPMMMPPPIGLAGPVRGIGGVQPQQMLPQQHIQQIQQQQSLNNNMMMNVNNNITSGNNMPPPMPGMIRPPPPGIMIGGPNIQQHIIQQQGMMIRPPTQK